MRERVSPAEEFAEGTADGRYILLECAWAVPSRWEGRLVAFLSRGDWFGVVSRSSRTWRCYMGSKEAGGSYGKNWWQEEQNLVVENLDEGLLQIDRFFKSHVS